MIFATIISILIFLLNNHFSECIISSSTGPFSDHGEFCNASWRPNLQEPLKKCGDNGQCPKEFSCSSPSDDGFCCPTKEKVCFSEPDSGHELENAELRHFGRFGYQPELRACIKFSYFGKGGNFNNFLRHSQCQQYCQNATRNER